MGSTFKKKWKKIRETQQFGFGCQRSVYWTQLMEFFGSVMFFPYFITELGN